MFTLYASCDVKYFLEHGYALAKSAAQNKTNLVLEVFPEARYRYPLGDFLISFMQKWEEEIHDFVILRPVDTKLYTDLVKCLDIKDIRSFYACYRFLNLAKILQEFDEILVIDVDAIINKPIVIPEGFDFGLHLREPDPNVGSEYERNGMRVAAGAVYVTRRAHKFVKSLQDYFLTNELKWFVDQHALFNAYQVCQDLSFFQIPKSLIDWDFNEDSMIFTAKGPRKDSDIWKKKKKEIIDGPKP